MRFRTYLYIFLSILFTGVLAAQTYTTFYPRYVQYRTRVLAEKIIAPYMQSARETLARDIANDDNDPGFISIQNPTGKFLRIPSYTTAFEKEDALNQTEIKALQDYFETNREGMGLPPGVKDFKFKFISQSHYGNKILVRFQQVVQRRIWAVYSVPLQGATVIATIANRRLTKIQANILAPPSFQSVFKNPGIVFAFTDNELARFISFFKTNEDSSKAFEEYLNNIDLKIL